MIMHRQDAQDFIDMAHKFYEQENYEEAVVYYKKALSYFRDSDLKIEEADSFLDLGNVYLELENYNEAEKHYQESLSIYSHEKDRIGEGYSLTGLGIVQEALGDYDQARDYYHNALGKFRKEGDAEREGIVHTLIASTYESQGAWEDALLDYQRSSQIFRKVGYQEKEQEIDEKTKEIAKNRSRNKISRKEIAIALGYLLALVAAEVSVTYYNMQLGLALEAVILFALLANSSLTKSYNFSILLRSMMALPIIRIIGLSIPLMQIPPLYWFPIIAIPLFASAYVIMRAQGLNRKNVGLIWGNIPVQLLIGATGVFLGTLEYLILQPKPLIATFTLTNLFFASIIIIISTGFAEEILFRGIIQKNAQNVLGALFGLLYTTLLFTVMHIGWNSFPDLIFVFAVGLFYGVAFYKTKSLFGVTLSHGVSNTFLFLIVPFYAPLVYSLVPNF